MAAILDKGQFRPLFRIFSVMSNTTEFCVFDLPVVYVYGSFPFDLDAIGIVLVHINSTAGSKWPPF